MKSLICFVSTKFLPVAVIFELMSMYLLTTPAFTCPLSYALNSLAMELKTDCQYKPAIDLLSLAILIRPNDAKNYIDRGNIYALSQETQNGIDDEIKGISLASNNTAKDREFRSLAHRNLAEIYLMTCSMK